MAVFPITIAPDAQNMKLEIPVHETKTSDGNEHSRKKHANKIYIWDATYTFDDHSDVLSVLSHFDTDRVSEFTYYDWRDGTSSNLTGCKWKSVSESVNRVGEYVVQIQLRQVV